jgi:hypothetical protein
VLDAAILPFARRVSTEVGGATHAELVGALDRIDNDSH